MHHRIGIAEAGAEGIVERDFGDLLPTHRIHQPQRVDIDRHFAGGIAHAEIVEGMEGVRPQLNTGTDFAEHRRAFQHDAAHAPLRQAHCRSQPTDAAPGDDDRKRAAHRARSS